MPRTLFSRCGVGSPTSFLPCQDLDAVSLADALTLHRDQVFFSLEGLCLGSAPIFLSTFVLPTFRNFSPEANLALLP